MSFQEFRLGPFLCLHSREGLCMRSVSLVLVQNTCEVVPTVSCRPGCSESGGNCFSISPREYGISRQIERWRSPSHRDDAQSSRSPLRPDVKGVTAKRYASRVTGQDIWIPHSPRYSGAQLIGSVTSTSPYEFSDEISPKGESYFPRRGFRPATSAV